VRVKTGKQYYTFISSDAVKALQSWMNIRQTLTGQAMSAGAPIFITNQKTAVAKAMLSSLFNRLAFASGLEVRKYGRASEVRYRFHSHELRDTFRSACTMAGVAYAVSEFLIGHEIDKLHYDKSPSVYPDHFRNEYMKVEGYVNIFSAQALGMKKLAELETKITEKDKVIESLAKNGQNRADEIAELNKKLSELGGMVYLLALGRNDVKDKVLQYLKPEDRQRLEGVVKENEG
jgi:uncharacterized coiled-coil protein SlyX